MAEYGSGIFYGRSNSNQSLSSISQVGILSLPPELDIGPPLTPFPLKGEDDDVPKDIILLAEFSEIEGPIPLLSIPHNYSKDTDLNDLVLQLMSTDYHSLGRSDFQVQKDICLLQEDSEKGHYTYVHYFTLFDVRARGFVRPMCLAYITRERNKLSAYFKTIQEEFSKTTEYLRTCNLQIFLKELEMRIRDLLFTKERYIQAFDRAPKILERVEDVENLNTKSQILERRRRSISLTSDPPRILSAIHASKATCVDNKIIDLQNHLLSLDHPCGAQLNQTFNHRDSSCECSALQESLLSTSLPLSSPLKDPKASYVSPFEAQKLTFHLRPQLKLNESTPSSQSDATLRGSTREFEGLSYSSDSSNTTVVSASDFKPTRPGVLVSSLMHDHSVNEVLGSSEEVAVLQHTSLDALALQILDCQYILEIVRKYLGKSDTQILMKQLLADIRGSSQSPLYNRAEKLGLLQPPYESKKEPSIFVISLMRRSFRNMRPIRSLCGVGYIAGISTLLLVYKKFSRPTLTLMFEKLDRELYANPFSTLFIGNIPIISMAGGDKSAKVSSEGSNNAPCAEQLNLRDVLWNEDLIRLLPVDLSKPSTPECEYADRRENLDRDDVAVADDCLEVFVQETSEGERGSFSPESPAFEGWALEGEDFRAARSNSVLIKAPSYHSTPIRSTSSDSSWASSTPRELNLLEGFESEIEDGEEEEAISEMSDAKGIRITRQDIDRRMALGKIYHITVLMQQFSGVSQCIVHSLLSGKPMIVAGPEYLKSAVTLYTKTLSIILPIKSTEFLPVLKWHTGTITPHHLKLYKIIGICIPERLHVQDLMSNATLNKVTVLNIETGHISGVAYSGSLLHKADQFSRRNFRTDLALQPALQSILMTLGMKAFLHFHLLKTTPRTSNEILKAIGVPRGDWLVVHYLSKLVEDQLADNVYV